MANVHVIIGEDDFLVGETAKKVIGDGGRSVLDFADDLDRHDRPRLAVHPQLEAEARIDRAFRFCYTFLGFRKVRFECFLDTRKGCWA